MKERPGPSGIRRPDFTARLLLAALVSVLVHGVVPLLLIRLSPQTARVLDRLVPSPDTTRTVEWLGLVVAPLLGPGLAGPFLMGSRRLNPHLRRGAGERELLRTGWLGLLGAQCLASPVGLAYYRSVNLPISAWEVTIATVMGLLAGAVGLCLVRILVYLCGGRRYLGAWLAMPVLLAWMAPAMLRVACPACRWVALWTPYLHASPLLESRAAWEPLRLIHSGLILVVFAAIGRSVVLNLVERKG